VEASARGLRAVTPNTSSALAGREPAHRGAPRRAADPGALAHARVAAEALRRYAAGERACYQGPLDLVAPELHRAVWERLRAIPFGATVTYGEIAADLGLAGEARAIGSAVGANPICVLIPCHRVMGADGSLRGYAWGLDLKRRLLAHEGSAAPSLFADLASI
jgi:methylated-DNA-[protein]-cysteine S-methyltransferase